MLLRLLVDANGGQCDFFQKNKIQMGMFKLMYLSFVADVK